MESSPGQILKSDEVKLEGQFHLNAAQAQINKPHQQSSPTAAPQVRVLENNSEHAVIGVICSCGTEISIKCDYADAQASEHPEG